MFKDWQCILCIWFHYVSKATEIELLSLHFLLCKRYTFYTWSDEGCLNFIYIYIFSLFHFMNIFSGILLHNIWVSSFHLCLRTPINVIYVVSYHYSCFRMKCVKTLWKPQHTMSTECTLIHHIYSMREIFSYSDSKSQFIPSVSDVSVNQESSFYSKMNLVLTTHVS